MVTIFFVETGNLVWIGQRSCVTIIEQNILWKRYEPSTSISNLPSLTVQDLFRGLPGEWTWSTLRRMTKANILKIGEPYHIIKNGIITKPRARLNFSCEFYWNLSASLYFRVGVDIPFVSQKRFAELYDAHFNGKAGLLIKF